MATAEILDLLQSGTLEVEGLLPWSSNYTFLVRICSNLAGQDQAEVSAVYKPRRGERPLWDFSQGTLCQRERAAFLLSDALGWDIVPPTILRDGPHGIGSFQFFIEHDPERHYFTFEGDRAYGLQLQKIVLFDIIANNADRKSGHVLLEQTTMDENSNAAMEVVSTELAAGRLWAIDHGVCFHTDYKLRTVIWEFAGTAIPPHLLADLATLKERLCRPDSPLLAQLKTLLTSAEITALQKRLDQLIKQTTFPNPGPGRHYPWPPV